MKIIVVIGSQHTRGYKLTMQGLYLIDQYVTSEI